MWGKHLTHFFEQPLNEKSTESRIFILKYCLKWTFKH